MVTVHHPPIEEEEREGETTTTIARLSFSGEQTTSDGAEVTVPTAVFYCSSSCAVSCSPLGKRVCSRREEQ